MPLFWFKSYFHATVTTQSGSCSKRTHLCHHRAFRVDTALLKCMLSIFTTLCSHEPTQLNKRASTFTSIETRSDMCLSNMSETSAVKTQQDACQLWRMTSRAAEDSTASEASCNKQCVCQQKKKGTQEWTGRCRCWENSCDLWIPCQNRSNSAEQRRGMFIGNRIRLVWFFSGCVSMSTKA